MEGRLAGKRIFLTGAAQGIGRAIAERCLAEGASICAIDRDAATLATTAAEIGAPSERFLPIVADITDEAAIRAAVAAAAKAIGTVDALINNAGLNVFRAPLDTTDRDWKTCFDVNLGGAWNCCRAVLPGMIETGGGVILNIASTHAFTIIPHTFPYPLAKHALIGLTKALAIEYAAAGIRVNALAPGYVETQNVIAYWNSFPDPEAARQRTLDLHPGHRIAKPREIANAAVFMISDECPFMNAACLVVDGGVSILHHPVD